MTSVEHVTEYADIAQEPAYYDYQVCPPGWPSEGNISFSHVSVVYPKSKARALNNVSVKIKGSEKVRIRKM